MDGSIIESAQSNDGIVGDPELPGTNLSIKVDGEWTGLTPARYERVQDVARYHAKGYTVNEIYNSLKDDYDIKKMAIREDVNLIKKMDTYPLSADTMNDIVVDYLRTAQQAKRRFWKISDREFEAGEDGNAFAAIKAARHAATTDKEVLQLLADIGFKAKDLAKRTQAEEGTEADEEIDRKIDEKLNALGIDDLGDLVD